MDKHWLLIGMATCMAALGGCAAAPARLPPPPQSESLGSSVTEPAAPAGTPKEAGTAPASDAATVPEVVVYGSVPQQSTVPTVPTVPCGLASLAWSLTHPEDAWRIVAPLLPDENIDECARNMRGESPVPLHLEK